MKKIQYVCLLMFLALIACNPVPEIDNATMLDGDQIFDASIAHPEKYLVSAYLPDPTDLEKSKPVVIAAHGYTATTFEWDELREYADSANTFLVSQVLLGGHGTTYTDFKSSSWENWQSSIIEEYTKLSNKGFRNIYLAGSSTGAPLIIQLFKTGFFDNYTKPKGVFLIDPIIVSSNKTLTLVGLLGPVLGYTTVSLDSGEQGKWYVYRPQETLKQLMELIDLTRMDLQSGITLPIGTYMKVYKSIVDETADPVSAVLIYNGMRTASGGNIDVEMIDSKIHVFTRLKGRNGVQNSDVMKQQLTFRDIESKVKIIAY